MSARLTDAEREALTWAVAEHGCIHTGRVNLDTPTGCGDCWRIAEEGVAPAVESILTAREAEAAARALEEAAELLMPYSGIGLSNNAPRIDVAMWLRDRALALRSE